MKSFLKWFVVLLIVICSGLYATTIQVKEDALDLLPEGIVASDLQLIQQLGMVNRVYISIGIDSESDISDQQWQQLRQSVLRAGSLLEQDPLLNTVIYRLPPDFQRSIFSELLPLLPVIAEPEDYRTFLDAITEEGVRKRLKRAFQMLNSPAGIGLKDQITRDPLGLSLLIFDKLKKLRGEFAITPRDGVFASADQKNCLIWADSSVSLTDSANAAKIKQTIDTALKSALQPGVSATLIGTLPHTLANIKTVNRDLRLLLPLATLTLIVFIIAVFRSFMGLLVVGIPFLAALPAIMIQNLVCGKVSALALGFGIVLTGLAVDFAVHIYLALSREQMQPQDILRTLQRPILMAWCTTTGVFAVLLFSTVPSHRQMAVLAIAGITLAVLISWLLVPTITPTKTKPLPPQQDKKKPRAPGTLMPVLCWVLLLAGGIICWPNLRYNGDMRVLDATNEQIKSDDLAFHNTWRGSVEQALVLAKGSTLDEALTVNDSVYSFLTPLTDQHIQSVAPLLPGPATRQQRQKMWQAFWQTHGNDVSNRLNTYGSKLGFIDGSFSPFTATFKTSLDSINPNDALHGSLYPLLASMIRLPSKTANTDSFLAMTLVPENDDTWPLLDKLEKQDERINIVSLRSWRVQAEQLLQQDIVRLSLWAGLLVVFLVTIFFRDARKVLATLAPVGSALAGMSLFAFISGQELNTMHVLMGIMVIGLCVDYGVFSVCSFGQKRTQTTRIAVTVCAVSSCIGFGVLTLANHPALHSLGVTVLVGIGVAWPTALWVTPAMLKEKKID